MDWQVRIYYASGDDLNGWRPPFYWETFKTLVDLEEAKRDGVLALRIIVDGASIAHMFPRHTKLWRDFTIGRIHESEWYYYSY